MAPKYRLMYFNIRALAEPIRFLFIYGNIDFEDYRYSEDEWFKELKPAALFGQGPLLEVDGDSKNRLVQSVAIQRYIASKVGLLGKDEWETFEIDMMAETLWDLRCLLYRWFFDKPINKEADKERILKEELPYLVERLDKTVQENDGHFVNGKLTWPDLQYTAMYEYLCHMAGHDFEAAFPNLRKLRETVSKIPQIKDWIERRPESVW